jgi:hypothetical protein
MVGAKIDRVSKDKTLNDTKLSTQLESIYSQLEKLDYQKSANEFISLLVKTFKSEGVQTIHVFEKFINKIKNLSARNEISGIYFSSVTKNQLVLPKKNFVKGEIQKIFQEVQKIDDFKQFIPFSATFEPLKKSVGDLLSLRLQNLCDGLIILHPDINFHEVLELIVLDRSNHRAEAIEVLKGAFGSAKTDLLLKIVLNQKSGNENPVDLKKLFVELQEFDSLKVLESAIHCFTSELYDENKSFITSILEHREVSLRELALKALIKFEKNEGEIMKYRLFIKQKN